MTWVRASASEPLWADQSPLSTIATNSLTTARWPSPAPVAGRTSAGTPPTSVKILRVSVLV